jgi:ankyrin repeat protein
MEAKNKYDTTPLHYACVKGNIDIIRYLVKQGADVEVCQSNIIDGIVI